MWVYVHTLSCIPSGSTSESLTDTLMKKREGEVTEEAAGCVEKGRWMSAEGGRTVGILKQKRKSVCFAQELFEASVR